MRTTTRGDWPRRYRAALRAYLARAADASLRPAFGLGRRAAALKLETLDVAQAHKQALAALALPDGAPRTRRDILDRARRFYAETIVPIERTHRAARTAGVRVRQLTRSLRRRTAESNAATRRLERIIARRQATEAVLARSGKNHLILLRKSRRLQNRLRTRASETMSAQEGERQATSARLRDEVVQTLLAIHLRLLTLKLSAKANTERLKKEIAGTQHLVKQSVKAVRRLSHEFQVCHQP